MRVPTLAFACCIIGMAAASAAALASASRHPGPPQTKGLQMSTRELLVAFTSQEAALERAAIFAKHGVEEIEQVGSSPLYLVRTGETADFKATKEAIAKEPGVKYAEGNIQMRTFKTGK